MSAWSDHTRVFPLCQFNGVHKQHCDGFKVHYATAINRGRSCNISSDDAAHSSCQKKVRANVKCAGCEVFVQEDPEVNLVASIRQAAGCDDTNTTGDW
jgi:hypothetical protein